MNNEQLIWNLLLDGIGNPYGAAAMMGNLRAESSLNPLNMTGTKAKQWATADEYVSAVNNGSYDIFSFAHDGIAFGLAQWLFWSRKQALAEYARGQDIGSVDVQMGYLFEELPKYSTVWSGLVNATDISAASDLVMLKYERPGTVTKLAKEKRRDFAFRYFDRYYKTPEESKDPPSQTDSSKLIVATTAPNVLVRCGNGKEFGSIGRIDRMNASYLWIASSENGWHAIKFGKQVGWVSGAYTKIAEG